MKFKDLLTEDFKDGFGYHLSRDDKLKLKPIKVFNTPTLNKPFFGDGFWLSPNTEWVDLVDGMRGKYLYKVNFKGKSLVIDSDTSFKKAHKKYAFDFDKKTDRILKKNPKAQWNLDYEKIKKDFDILFIDTSKFDFKKYNLDNWDIPSIMIMKKTAVKKIEFV